MKLPVQPPIAPMLAQLSRAMPDGEGWLYEPKWDGFRALVFWDGDEMLLQSRDRKPLGRYFPELEASLCEVMPPCTVLDGEIVIAGPDGLDFDALLMRIHPAASRVKMLAAQTPSSFVAFDLLAADSENLMEEPQEVRRQRLEQVLGKPRAPLYLTPMTRDRDEALRWFEAFEGAGLDGVIAKRAAQRYRPDERAMLKIKHQRTAECVVGGFRWYKDAKGTAVGSLLLGLYDSDGVLHHVGHTSSFKQDEKKKLVSVLEPYRDETGEASFGHGRTPGTPSRWTQGKDLSWESLRPELVCEVAYDHLQGDRFRHAATFLRWRPDKPPRECNYDQLQVAVPYALREIFG
ncbi:MAG: ATP-dependent DNA ligase [Armatimonadetes bacterium]|nr:ATP-dependent DNA ligase [Armatimonadota bacterium]